ncbi:MAG: hypothetical protein RL226_412 [Bacteroidota bacterium]|jgi:uncharacterized protein (TIGR02757 family)
MEDRYNRYNRTDFIASDPIQIPHRFSKKEDIEISAFFAATIAWGNRASIIKSASSLMERMDHAPHAFVCNAADADMKKLESFVHRTFNGTDVLYFVHALKQLYAIDGLEGAFSKGFKQGGAAHAITSFREHFLSFEAPARTGKHIASPAKGSSAKRLNMFLRWMVRSGDGGVDFGLWKSIRTADLMLPLDVHTGNVSRNLGLLQRKQDDWKAVEEVTEALRLFDPNDPVKYDFALFGMGVFEGTGK